MRMCHVWFPPKFIEISSRANYEIILAQSYDPNTKRTLFFSFGLQSFIFPTKFLGLKQA